MRLELMGSFDFLITKIQLYTIPVTGQVKIIHVDFSPIQFRMPVVDNRKEAICGCD
jgi:hypothetical protein